jgi:hypothetical protein
MTKFKNFEEAREFAEVMVEDMEKGERLLVMKKRNSFLVTCDYKEAKDLGYEMVVGIYKY